MLRFRVLLSTVVILAICRAVPAQSIEIKEKATGLVLREGQGSKLVLAVTNPLPQTVEVRVRVEVLDPQGNVEGKAEKEEAIVVGEHSITLPFPFWDKLTDEQIEEIPWYRLRYNLEIKNTPSSRPASGIVAIGEITPQLFDLTMVSARELAAGSSYPVHLRTRQPITLRPVRGVSLQAKLELGNDDNTTLHAKGVTDRNGNATLVFAIPVDVHPDSAEGTVTAANGSLHSEVSSLVSSVNAGAALITTDKPIYQPGQVLHMRALLISKSKRVQAKTTVTVTITDPDNTTGFNESLESSRFCGV